MRRGAQRNLVLRLSLTVQKQNEGTARHYRALLTYWLNTFFENQRCRPERFRRYSERPNILSSGRGFGDQFDISQYGFHDLTGAMFISRTGPRKYDRDMYESHTDGSLAWTFDASRNSAVYGASGTNQPASVRFLCLIRAYQA